MSSLRERVTENKENKHPFDYVTLSKKEGIPHLNVGHKQCVTIFYLPENYIMFRLVSILRYPLQHLQTFHSICEKNVGTW